MNISREEFLSMFFFAVIIGTPAGLLVLHFEGSLLFQILTWLSVIFISFRYAKQLALKDIQNNDHKD